jgi:hypothetical protein
MSNIQKEISQLENWLNSLPLNAQSTHEDNYNKNNISDEIKMYMNNISIDIHTINAKLNYQEEILNNINDRLQLLENVKSLQVNEPWIDNNIMPLQNEFDDIDNNSETLYEIHKENESCCDNMSVKTPEIVPNIPDDISCIPDIQDNDTVSHKNEIIEPETVEEQEEDQEEEQEVEQQEEEEQEEEVEQEEQEVEQEEQKVEQEVEQEEQEVEHEEEQEEEEEEGIELEEITYKDKTYFMDDEKFVYANNDGEPSENPIGYWKEATQSIAFYKVKSTA